MTLDAGGRTIVSWTAFAIPVYCFDIKLLYPRCRRL